MTPIKRISSWRDLVAPRDNLTVRCLVCHKTRESQPRLRPLLAESSVSPFSPLLPPSHCQPELLFLAGAHRGP